MFSGPNLKVFQKKCGKLRVLDQIFQFLPVLINYIFFFTLLYLVFLIFLLILFNKSFFNFFKVMYVFKI